MELCNPFSPLDLAEQIVEKYDLQDFVAAASTGHHVWNPYHNLEHELITMAHGYRFLRPHEVEEQMMKAFLIACLFHDHNHHGDTGNDKGNVDRSIAFLETPYMKRLLEEQTFPCSSGVIQDIIRCTVFVGGQFPVDPTNVYQRCIRDADLMMVYTEDGRRYMNGLFRETTGKWLTEHTGDNIRQHLAANYIFLKSCKMFTREGNAMRDNHLDRAAEVMRTTYLPK